MRHVKPLRGWCVVEMLPAEAVSAGGIQIPEMAVLPAQSEQGRAKILAPQGLSNTATVVEIGPWPLAQKGPKKGFQKPPEFRLGDTVIVPPKAGIHFQWGTGRPLRLVHQDDVLGVIPSVS